MARLNLTLIFFLLVTTQSALAVVTKTFTPTSGYTMLSINSERHKPQSQGAAVFGLQLEASMGTRWQMQLATISSFDETFSGTKLGATYQFGSRFYEVGAPTLGGYGQSTRVFPKWRSHVSAALGRWRYNGRLRSTSTQIVKLQSVPVKADVYGFSFGYHLYRLISEDFYLSGELNSTQGLAPGFNLSAYSALFGLAWWL
jgi:hypothetical protein